MSVPSEFRQPPYHPDRSKLPARLVWSGIFALAGLVLIGSGLKEKGLLTEALTLAYFGLSV